MKATNNKQTDQRRQLRAQYDPGHTRFLLLSKALCITFRERKNYILWDKSRLSLTRLISNILSFSIHNIYQNDSPLLFIVLRFVSNEFVSNFLSAARGGQGPGLVPTGPISLPHWGEGPETFLAISKLQGFIVVPVLRM